MGERSVFDYARIAAQAEDRLLRLFETSKELEDKSEHSNEQDLHAKEEEPACAG